MTVPRRRIVRSGPAPAVHDGRRQRQLQRLRARLEQEQTALARWMSRLKRAFHAVEKGQLRVTRMQKTIARQEE